MKKTTKLSLVLSVFMMILSVSMLVSTTFAWFTDSASTGVNKIVAGNLDVDIEDAAGESLDGKSLAWVAHDGRAQEEILWEPGCTYELQPFKVVNKGTLALNYKVKINGVASSAKLLEVITFTYKIGTEELSLDTPATLEANSKSEDIVITATMAKDAGNEYQGLVLAGMSITVYATQAAVEEDSFDKDYDALSLYDDKTNTFTASSADDIKAIASAIKPGDTVKLGADVTISERIGFTINNITFDGNGHTITVDRGVDVNNNTIVFGADGKWCQNITVKNLNVEGNGGRVFHFHGGDMSTLENVTISGNFALPINFYGTHGATLINCDISSTCTEKYANSSVFSNQQPANQLILINTKIDDIYINVRNNDLSTLVNSGVKLVVKEGSTVGKVWIPEGTTITPYSTDGGTITSVDYIA